VVLDEGGWSMAGLLSCCEYGGAEVPVRRCLHWPSGLSLVEWCILS